MLGLLQRYPVASRVWIWVVAAGVVLGAAFLGCLAPERGLILGLAALGGAVLLQHPRLGLWAIVPCALVVRVELSTGSEVSLNAATAIVSVSLAVWLIDMVRRGGGAFASSRTNLPLILFLASGLLSLLIGSATWDPAVSRPGGFFIVQLAQWAILALSAGAFWLAANLGRGGYWLRRLLLIYLCVGGFAAGIFATGGRVPFLWGIPTFAVQRAPFWLLLAATALGQLFFNGQLSVRWRLLLIAVLVVVAYAVFFELRATASHWVGVAAAVGVLTWLRWPRLRWVAIMLLIALPVSGFLSSVLYDFAGGDAEWEESGGSRLALGGRVVEVTMRNPITGLGPAAYRLYAQVKPLSYGGAFWIAPSISSHNNYIDLFSHVGLLGLGLFLWFAVEVILLALRLRKLYTSGFEAGYVSSMLAAWAGALVLMLFGDWILPFVYNIGFRGYQASVLVWLFLGGLVALENMDSPQVSGAAIYAQRTL